MPALLSPFAVNELLNLSIASALLCDNRLKTTSEMTLLAVLKIENAGSTTGKRYLLYRGNEVLGDIHAHCGVHKVDLCDFIFGHRLQMNRTEF